MAGCRGVLVVPARFGLPPLVQVIVGGGRTGKRGEPRSSARVRADSGRSAGPSPPGRSGPDQPTPAGAPGNSAVWRGCSAAGRVCLWRRPGVVRPKSVTSGPSRGATGAAALVGRIDYRSWRAGELEIDYRNLLSAVI